MLVKEAGHVSSYCIRTHTQRERKETSIAGDEKPPPSAHRYLYTENSDEILWRHFPYLLLVVFLWTIRQTAGWLSYRILRVGGRHFEVIVERERESIIVSCVPCEREIEKISVRFACRLSRRWRMMTICHRHTRKSTGKHQHQGDGINVDVKAT